MCELLGRTRAHHGLILSLIAAAVAGCEDDPIQPKTAQLVGTVELQGTLTDAAGVPLEPRVVEDVTGLVVYLATAGALVDSAATALGTFLFEDVAPGSYEIVTWIVPAGVVSTGPFEVGSERIYTVSPLPIADPLVLVPSVFATAGARRRRGDATDAVPVPGTPVDSLAFAVFPNPSSSTSHIEYTLASESMVDLGIENVRKTSIRDLVSAVQPAGRQRATWDGMDSGGQAVAPGLYIATSFTETTEGWDLILREEETAGRSGESEPVRSE